MAETTPMERDSHRGQLERRGGRWYIDGVAVHAGDLVEVRRAKVGEQEIGEEWIPAVVGADGNAVELEGSSDFVPGSRATGVRAAGLRTLFFHQAEIRRVQTGVPAQRRKSRAAETDADLQRAEGEGMVTEAAKVSATDIEDDA
jgi:hypothetical protein